MENIDEASIKKALEEHARSSLHVAFLTALQDALATGLGIIHITVDGKVINVTRMAPDPPGGI
jgi:hypothetical protein